MSNPAITKFTSVDINGKEGFYVPKLTTKERDNIPADILQNGGVIYNIDIGMLQARQEDSWQDLCTKQYIHETFRSGTIKVGNVGEVVTGIPKQLEVTGDILSATLELAEEGDNNVVLFTFADNGVTPIPILSIADSSGNNPSVLTEPVVIENSNNQCRIALGEVDNIAQDLTVSIILVSL